MRGRAGNDVCRGGTETGTSLYQCAGVPLLLTAWVPKLALDEMRVGNPAGLKGK